MNSVQAAQKTWNGLTNKRYCPPNDELPWLVQKVLTDEPLFVEVNAIRRLKGHLHVLRAIIEFEPKSEEEAKIKEQDIKDLQNRPFYEECLFPDEPHKYHQ